MNDDKKNRCYICGKDRATVIIKLFLAIKKQLEFWLAYKWKALFMELHLLYVLFEYKARDIIQRTRILDQSLYREWIKLGGLHFLDTI